MDTKIDIGVKYADKQARHFDDEKIKAGQCVIGLQVTGAVIVKIPVKPAIQCGEDSSTWSMTIDDEGDHTCLLVASCFLTRIIV